MSSDSNQSEIDAVKREMEDLFLLQWMAAVLETPPHNPRWNHTRLQWDERIEQLIHENKFASEYRMSVSAHNHLIELLGPRLQRVEWNSRGSSGPILVEHIIAIGLRALAGGCLKEAGNVISYYSGHYESHGVNCQACVRSDLSFMYFGVVSPGSTNDNISYPLAVGLKDTIESLPPGLYCVADAAYTLQENLLIPFTGLDRTDKAHDAFNFYMSQLRIRVEMAFGRLTNKFRILKGSMIGSLDRITAIVIACARLHNFVIKMDGVDAAIGCDEVRGEATIVKDAAGPLGMAYLPVVPNDEWVEFEGMSYTRAAIVEYLRESSIQHPLYNLERKRMAVLESTNNAQWDSEYISPS